MALPESQRQSEALFDLDARFELWSDAETADSRDVLRRGSVRLHRRFRSRFLGNDRTIAVYLPPSYFVAPFRRHPVLYMQDGQNLFDPATAFAGVDWRIDRTIERLAEERACVTPIVVGVYNTPSRVDEYTPSRDAIRGVGGRADEYGRFLVFELKPFVDRAYRTLPGRMTTGIGGSSLGGLAALWLAERYDAVFSFTAALSPSLWWDREFLRRQVAVRASYFRDVRAWIDIGTEEGSLGDDGVRVPIRHARALVDLLRNGRAEDPRHLHFEEFEGGRHHESAWGARFDRVLEFWLAS